MLIDIPIYPSELAAALQLIVLVPSWLAVSYFLLSRRRRVRQLVPGAVISAMVQLALGWATALYVPALIERQASRYGVIGVAFALVSWLVLVAGGIVVSAVMGAELGSEVSRNRHGRADPDRGPEPGPDREPEAQPDPETHPDTRP